MVNLSSPAMWAMIVTRKLTIKMAGNVNAAVQKSYSRSNINQPKFASACAFLLFFLNQASWVWMVEM